MAIKAVAGTDDPFKTIDEKTANTSGTLKIGKTAHQGKRFSGVKFGAKKQAKALRGGE